MSSVAGIVFLLSSSRCSCTTIGVFYFCLYALSLCQIFQQGREEPSYFRSRYFPFQSSRSKRFLYASPGTHTNVTSDIIFLQVW